MSNLSYSLRSYLKTSFVFFSLEKNFLYISRKLKRKKAIFASHLRMFFIKKIHNQQREKGVGEVKSHFLNVRSLWMAPWPIFVIYQAYMTGQERVEWPIFWNRGRRLFWKFESTICYHEKIKIFRGQKKGQVISDLVGWFDTFYK